MNKLHELIIKLVNLFWFKRNKFHLIYIPVTFLVAVLLITLNINQNSHIAAITTDYKEAEENLVIVIEENEDLKQENEDLKNELHTIVEEKDIEIEELKEEVVKLQERRSVQLASRGNYDRQPNINYSPHSKSGFTIEILNSMLINTGLAGYGESFYTMEQEYNVNALFAIAVACHESANGYKKANTNNYFGFKGNNGWMSFESTHSCIMYFGKLISNNYNNYSTIEGINGKYCPDGGTWSGYVKQHMREKYNKVFN